MLSTTLIFIIETFFCEMDAENIQLNISVESTLCADDEGFKLPCNAIFSSSMTLTLGVRSLWTHNSAHATVGIPERNYACATSWLFRLESPYLSHLSNGKDVLTRLQVLGQDLSIL